MKKLKMFACLIVTFFAIGHLHAQQPNLLSVKLNQTSYQQGDSIYLDIYLLDKDVHLAASTVNLCMEEVKSGRKWKYRYPMIGGYVGAGILIDSTIPNGLFALTCQLQPDFFHLEGVVKNRNKNEPFIRSMLCTKNKQFSTDTIAIDENNHFKTGRMLFQDSAIILFSRLSKRKNDVDIELVSPLDSVFKPVYTTTRFFTVGSVKDDNYKELIKDTVSYHYADDGKFNGQLLSTVVVKGKAKKLVDAFASEHVSPLFSSDDAVVLDGLESDEISKSYDILSFIRSHVAGFEIEMDDFGSKKVKKRKQHTDIYINEIKVTEDELDAINPVDIAMIKVFRPGVAVSFSTGEGGAIAVYTKIGNYAKANSSHYSFLLRGYSGLDLLWK